MPRTPSNSGIRAPSMRQIPARAKGTFYQLFRSRHSTLFYHSHPPSPPSIEAEQALVVANRELITRFEKQIQSTLALIWGEAPKVRASGV